jgi:hypothetical protein
VDCPAGTVQVQLVLLWMFALQDPSADEMVIIGTITSIAQKPFLID